MKPRRFILASVSPQRRVLLKSLRVPFTIVPPRVREDSRTSSARRLVAELALRKARAVAARHAEALVLGADTVVVAAGRIIVKPKNRADSLRILRLLNGRWQRVYTGVALVEGGTGRSWKEVAVSRVKARRLSESELKRLSGKHLDKAGGYAVQDREDPFVERIVGPFDNVIGLPLASVRRLLKLASRRRR